MSADELDVNDMSLINYLDNQAIVIALDIETNAAVAENAGVGVIRRNVIGRLPIRLFRIRQPRFQCILRVGMNCPKLAQWRFCDYSHGLSTKACPSSVTQTI